MLKIVLADHDKPLAVMLMKLIGCTISRGKGNYWILTIYSQEHVYYLLRYMNVHFRTPKIHAFTNCVKWLNEQTVYPIIIPEGLSTASIEKDAWLSGMMDSDGSFKITYRMSETSHRAVDVRLSMLLTQLHKYHVENTEHGDDYVPVMLIIAKALKGNLIRRTRDRGVRTESNVGVYVKSLPSRLLLIQYLHEFPMKSSKHNDSVDWIKAHELVVSKQVRTPEGTDKPIQIKQGMNSKRTHFD